MLLVFAPLSVLVVRRLGTKVVVAGGLLMIALGLGLLSHTSVHSTYGDSLPYFVLIGAGVGLAIAPSTESVLGSLPKEEAGVGSASSDTSMQIGGALGVAVLGTALAIRYKDVMTPLLAHRHLPAAVEQLILGSLGGALAVAQRAPGAYGEQLAEAARRGFISGMDLGFTVAAAVVGVAGVVVLAVLPSRPPPTPAPEGSSGRWGKRANEPKPARMAVKGRAWSVGTTTKEPKEPGESLAKTTNEPMAAGLARGCAKRNPMVRLVALTHLATRH